MSNVRFQLQISPITKKVALFYGLWVLACILFSVLGYGDSKFGHVCLAFTGLPLAFLSFHIIPNGSVFATFIAGAIGWVQWCLLAEANSRFLAWRKSRNV